MGSKVRDTIGKPAVLLSAVLLVLSFTAPACGNKGATISADEIVAKAVAAQESLVSYQFDLHRTRDISAEADGHQIQGHSGSSDTDMSGAVDETNRKMKVDVTKSGVSGLDMVSFDEGFRELVVGGTMYAGFPRAGGELKWSRIELIPGFWEKAEMVGQQLELLQSSGRKLAGSDKVGGIDCYVFKVTADSVEMWSVLNQEYLLGRDTMFGTMQANWIKSTSLTQWIAKDTAHMMKSEMRMVCQIPAEDMIETPGAYFNITAEAEVLFHDYDVPVSIELPAEATE